MHEHAEAIAERIEQKARRCLRGDGFTGKASRYPYEDLFGSLRDVAWAATEGQRIQHNVLDDDDHLELVDDVTVCLIELIDGTVV